MSARMPPFSAGKSPSVRKPRGTHAASSIHAPEFADKPGGQASQGGHAGQTRTIPTATMRLACRAVMPCRQAASVNASGFSQRT